MESPAVAPVDDRWARDTLPLFLKAIDPADAPGPVVSIARPSGDRPSSPRRGAGSDPVRLGDGTHKLPIKNGLGAVIAKQTGDTVTIQLTGRRNHTNRKGTHRPEQT